MDWIQFPFEVNARLLDGPGAPLVRLRWVYTDEPFLPITQEVCVNNRVWNEDQDSDLRIGQLPIVETGYRQDARWTLPPGFNADHICHPEWLFTGEPFPNNLPPTKYDDYGIPTCCGPQNEIVAGGLAIGGEVGDVFGHYDSAHGGIAVGGEVGDEHTGEDATAGGLALGGLVGDAQDNEDATAGGLALGGLVGDELTYFDGTDGGIELGGEVGDEQQTQDAPTGGYSVGGTVGDVMQLVDGADGGQSIGGLVGDLAQLVDTTAGGLAVGGTVGDELTYFDTTAGGLAIGGTVGDVFTNPSPLPYTNGTFSSSLQGDSLNFSSVFYATDQFTFSSGATITQISIDVLLFFAPTGTTVSWRIGNAAFGFSAASGVSIPTVTAMGAGPSGQLIYRLTWTVSVALTAGSWWLTIIDVLRTSLGGVKWQFTSGATNTAQADSGGTIGSTTPHWFMLS